MCMMLCAFPDLPLALLHLYFSLQFSLNFKEGSGMFNWIERGPAWHEDFVAKVLVWKPMVCLKSRLTIRSKNFYKSSKYGNTLLFFGVIGLKL